MSVCGIDPGLKGGIARIDGAWIEAWPMPVLDGAVSTPVLHALLALWEPDHVVVETQTILGKQAGALRIGANYGRILGLLELLTLPHSTVPPAVWNRKAGIRAGLQGRAKKEAAFAAATREWGEAFSRLGLRPAEDGQVEALLIARYGRKD